MQLAGFESIQPGVAEAGGFPDHCGKLGAEEPEYSGIAHQLNILPDSLVFADDNPAEREIVRQQRPV